MQAVELRVLPGPKIRTRGTHPAQPARHLIYFFASIIADPPNWKNSPPVMARALVLLGLL